MNSNFLRLLGRKMARAGFCTAVAASAWVWSGDLTPETPADLISTAHAVIGRPLTPVSYAGVARRTTRRAVVATAAVTAPVVVAAPTTVVVVPANDMSHCAKMVDASTGQTTYRCP